MQSHPGGDEKLHLVCGVDLSYKPCKPPPIKPPSCQWLIAAKTVPEPKTEECGAVRLGEGYVLERL